MDLGKIRLQLRKRKLGTVAAVISTLFIACLTQQRSAPATSPDPLSAACLWIARIQHDAAEIIISPIQKMQANNHLDKMLRELGALELSKRRLIELIDDPQTSSSQLPKAVETIDGALDKLRDTTDEFVDFLPQQYRSDGRTVARSLVEGLSVKKQIYDNGLNKLATGQLDREKFRKQELVTVCLISRLQDSVQRLQAAINGSAMPTLRNCPEYDQSSSHVAGSH